jgi:hypothetical protein
MTAMTTRDHVRAVPSGWVVSGPTGTSIVCRTYDELVDVVSERSGVDRRVVSAAGLAERVLCTGQGTSQFSNETRIPYW